jgi:hypothetical protein
MATRSNVSDGPPTTQGDGPRLVVHHTVEFDTTDEDKAVRLIAYAKRIGVTHYLRDHYELREGERG